VRKRPTPPSTNDDPAGCCETGQRQRVASMPRAKPVKGAPNVVGTPAIVGIPAWVVAHVAVLGDVARGAEGLESGLVPRGVSELATGADGFGLRATDGGLMPPLPSSVEPSGIPAGPTDEPGPIDEAAGADAAQAPGALAAIPPPSKSAGLDSPGIEFAMPADAPVIGLPMPADTGADEAPAHVAPITGDAPDVIGLTPGVASSVAPMGIPVCPTGAFGMPSGDVMPSAGSGATFIRACAWAEPQPKRTAAVAIAKRVILSRPSFILPFMVSRPAKPSRQGCNHTGRTSLCMDCCDLLDPALGAQNRLTLKVPAVLVVAGLHEGNAIARARPRSPKVIAFKQQPRNDDAGLVTRMRHGRDSARDAGG
jgi:hypothetical protein